MSQLIYVSTDFLWTRKWQPIPVFLPEEFHGQRSLASYSSWGHKESDTARRPTHTHTHTHNRSRWGSAIWICIRLQVRWAWLPAAVWVQVNFIYVLAGAQASRTRHILRTSGRIPGDWAELHENYMKNGAERMLSRARTLYKHKDRHTWFIVLCLIAFFTNWKFVATLLWASLSAPWFQQHFLITSCLCVTFW